VGGPVEPGVAINAVPGNLPFYRLFGGTQRCHDATYIVILDGAASQAERSLNPLFVFQRDHQRAAPVEQDSSDSGHIWYLLGGSHPRASHDPRGPSGQHRLQDEPASRRHAVVVTATVTSSTGLPTARLVPGQR